MDKRPVKINCFLLSSVLSIAAFSCLPSQAEVNPGIYLRITRCNNINATILVNESIVLQGNCARNLAWQPVFINPLLIAQKNKLRFEIRHETAGDFYGSLTFELLKSDSSSGTFKRFHFEEIDLRDTDKFQLGIDNLIRRQGWSVINTDSGKEKHFVTSCNRRDSIDYYFKMQNRFYLTVSSAKHAIYKISVNDQSVMQGALHINSFQESYYTFYNYPYFFMNLLDKSTAKVTVDYKLETAEGKREAFLEIVLYHYLPNAADPLTLSVSKFTCAEGEVIQGKYDLTEILKRNEFFNR